MNPRLTNAFVLPESNVKLAKRCLALIRDIAARGACSEDPEHIGYALEELSQVLFERTGIDERLFEPKRADLIADLGKLHEELALVDSFSEDFQHRDETFRDSSRSLPVTST